MAFTPLPAVRVKGRAEPVSVYRPATAARTRQEAEDSQRGDIRNHLDRLSPSEQLTLKVASAIGFEFSTRLLATIFPEDAAALHLDDDLRSLEGLALITRVGSDLESVEENYVFQDRAMWEVVYKSMLFAQRRHLHRQIAEWYERTCGEDLAPHYAALAHHWRASDEPAKAMAYLEKAGQQAQARGDFQGAEQFFQQSLELETESATLSADYHEASK